MNRESAIKAARNELMLLNHANRTQEKQRLAEATARDPAIGQLVEERRTNFIQSVHRVLAVGADGVAIGKAAEKRNEEIRVELQNRLQRAGLPLDTLQPIFHCPACKDTGDVGEIVKSPCACLHERVNRLLVQDSVSSHVADTHTFDTWDDTVFPEVPIPNKPNDTQRSYMKRVRASMLQYAEELPNPKRPNLLLFGCCGVGKTFILDAIAAHARAHGVPVLSMTAYQLAHRVRQAIFDREPEAFQIAVTAPVLILDDLGTEPTLGTIMQESLFTLVNERGLARLPLIVSTNLSITELQQRYSERFNSRLFDNRQTLRVELFGKDLRSL